MTPRNVSGAVVLVLTLATMLVAPGARADDPVTPPPAAAAPADSLAAPATPAVDSHGIEHLVPELSGRPFGIDPGTRPFLRRLSVAPAYGRLGNETLFSLRVAYYSYSWLGYEASISHNPSHSVQAIVHRLDAIVRKPLPGRFQPYLTGGYGMTIVLPGRSVNADPVTKNALVYGGGLELFVRSDLALRAEMLGMTVMGRQQYRQGLVAYDYREETIALAFYRTLKP